MWVKICGNTNVEDALDAVEAGADALGFVLIGGSPRAISRKRISEILALLPATVMSVGVVADEDPVFIRDLLRVCPFNTIQFHGNESPEEVLRFKGRARIFKAIRVKDESSLAQIPAYRGVDAVLLDTYHPRYLGGTGATFDWGLAVKAKEFGLPVILAGGLTPTNVYGAIRQVQPFGVDVASGVESAPGVKDPQLVRSFIVNAK